MGRSVFDLNLTELSQLARWVPGEPLTAVKLNESVDRHNLLVGGVRVPTRVVGGPSLSTPVEAPATLRLQVKSAADGDYLQCRKWDGVTAGDYVYVAKPYTLRASVTSRAGVSYTYLSGNVTRTATRGGDSETQIIVPSYYLNDEIWAVRATTGVTRSDEDLVWLDMNVDGRDFKRQVT